MFSWTEPFDSVLEPQTGGVKHLWRGPGFKPKISMKRRILPAALVPWCLVLFASCQSEMLKELVKEQEARAKAEAVEEAARSMTPPTEDPEHVRVLFAGDTHFIWGVADLQKKNGPRMPAGRLEGLFHSASFRILNLETAVAERGEPISKKAFIFNAHPPAAIEALRALRLDLAVLGNNHSMDLGVPGMEDTIALLRSAGIATVGAGKNSQEAGAPYYFVVDGVKFALLSYSDIGTPDIFSTFARPGVASMRSNPAFAVKKYAREVDHVLVSLHWGIEYYTKPTAEQTQIARALIDAGASAVIGHHAHIPQGVEVYRGGGICYSLGNFLFGSQNPYQTENLILRMDVRKKDHKLARVTLFPTQGAYRHTGHAVRLVPLSESRPFWQEFFVQSQDLNADFARRFSLTEAGAGQVIIAGDSEWDRAQPASPSPASANP